MESLSAALKAVWDAVMATGESLPPGWEVFQRFPWDTFIDIGIMTCIVYQAYVRFRRTRALRVLEGVAVLGVGGIFAQEAGLFLTSWLLGGISAAALIFVIVIFQAEIRQMLEQVPGLSTGTLLSRVRHVRLPEESLSTLANTFFTLAAKRCGAIAVFERRDFLEPLLRSPGTLVGAQISAELVENLFTPPTPLHDGALYVRGERIYRAGCVLPLSENPQLASFYGTRHRAALGISEQSDAVVVVVSEERGAVSAAENGTLEVIRTPEALLHWLTDRLSTPGGQAKRRWAPTSLVTYNWRPKLAALAVVGLLWFVLVGRQDTEIGFTVPVVYTNLPKELTIQNQRANEVYISVRGSAEMLTFLDPARLRVSIDLGNASPGTQRYDISSKDINIPLGLELVGVNPSTIRLHLQKKPPTLANGAQ